MPDCLPQTERQRWADVARRTHALGATTAVQSAIDRSILTHPLDTAERCLDELEAAATDATARALGDC